MRSAATAVAASFGCADQLAAAATKARAAAQAVAGLVAVPDFGSDRPDKATDFNDLATLAGLDAVRACFAEIEGATCSH